MLFTNKKACQNILGWDRKVQTDDKASGHINFAPTFDDNFNWNLDRLTAAQFYLDQRTAGFTVKMAGQAATRLYNGLCDYPDADQLTVVQIENGSASIMPADKIDLASGFVSGGYLATALLIDVRNLRTRVQRAIEADAAVIGARGE
ncbi:hypothetical protein GCM10011529_30670 [Polymorphobacter glacialis]|uniref:Uncharacterized protein n=1 Tax=Sandarakinorhabdus glacialis TaxID=1614636 RepID=A0A917A189_9SPHN|nr:hypothetical protein [Polymorphobacter glacialis]GGE21918.1 hypothetical protein GCM10011529_30670 [Polymorphobacter glacialis]